MHGLGQSSRIFATGAQQPNLVEFLNRFGLDVWLLDDRGSIELPGANQPFNLDQIAAIDLPESIERIARATDGADLALFAHGWGAAAAWMYVLSGKADRVSRFISSQLGPIVDVPAGERWRAQFHTDELWRRLGVRVLGGYDPEPRAAVRLWRSLGPGNGGTAGDIARRIDGLYGNVANGKNLSERVKAALSDFYGPVSVMAGEHVQSIARSGRLVDAAGTDRYLATDKRPDIPILLLHGLENKVSLPSALPKSLRWLLPSQAAAGPIGVLVPDYGQDDSILGHRAARDVFPAVARHLDAMRNA
jgi:cholesterol oxidase